MSEFHAEAPQAIASERLALGPYVVAGAGFEPTTLRSTDIDSTNEPHTPHSVASNQRGCPEDNPREV